MAGPRSTPDSAPLQDAAGLTFLLSQVGAHGSRKYGERLEPLGLKPAHAAVLRAIRGADGLSQQSLGESLGVFPSRLVGLIDELERRGLVQRRDSPTDRRSYALHLAEAGAAILGRIDEAELAHQDEICATLSEAERVKLAGFLRRIVAAAGLKPGVHPNLNTSDGGLVK